MCRLLLCQFQFARLLRDVWVCLCADMKAPVGLLNLDLEILPLKHPEAPKGSRANSVIPEAALNASPLASMAAELAVFIEQSDVLKQLNAEQAKIQRTHRRCCILLVSSGVVACMRRHGHEFPLLCEGVVARLPGTQRGTLCLLSSR